MGWYKAHSSLNGDRGSSDLIDRCINWDGILYAHDFNGQ